MDIKDSNEDVDSLYDRGAFSICSVNTKLNIFNRDFLIKPDPLRMFGLIIKKPIVENIIVGYLLYQELRDLIPEKIMGPITLSEFFNYRLKLDINYYGISKKDLYLSHTKINKELVTLEMKKTSDWDSILLLLESHKFQVTREELNVILFPFITRRANQPEYQRFVRAQRTLKRKAAAAAVAEDILI